MNTECPNSQKNTTLLSIIKAVDSTTNLHIALDMYKTHIQEMQGMSFKVGPHHIVHVHFHTTY